MASHDDDHLPEDTQGYKLSQPKQSLAEYQQMGGDGSRDGPDWAYIDPATVPRGPAIVSVIELDIADDGYYTIRPIERNPVAPPNTPATSAAPSRVQSRAVSREASPVHSTEANMNPNEDAGDESLQRYKESLGLGGGGKDLSDPNDPRVCIIESLALESPGRDPVTIDLSKPGSEVTLKEKPFKIKEGVKFTMVAVFRVQHEILSGLQYVQVVKRKGIRVSKDSEMMGSYAPNTDKNRVYTKRFQEEDAPSGMLARGHYNAVSSFVDDDKKTHLTFEWAFDIAKDW